ncbi:ABC transporter substrate-binding protein [Streptomyces montanisoli]|uniref:Peptide ABC transporter substrate-binding protein n=1 Tax=Streptomyces montanisoli TaxID=2798581 RepID=A0A940MIU5_9ACTN|nr:peptide ABC transporter substrate-binding protein [Streptomyces montanisoli]MBP0462019.1 peptide ABC transporter substrate-binding protein [Streptomyces montanisoli]
MARPVSPCRAPRRRPTRLLPAGLAAAALVTAAGVLPYGAFPGAAQKAHAADGTNGGGRKVLTVAVRQSVDSLSPFLAQSLVATTIHRLAYSYLTNYDPKDGHAIPGFATSWKSSPDKLVWTYTIRKNSRWSDGVPATAQDAAWTFRKMMTDPDAATANGSFTANFAEVTAPDPTTLVIRLKKPQADMTALDVPIVPKHIWDKVTDFSTFNNDKKFPIVGNGPFVITDYKVDQYVKLKPNKTFWRGAPKFDELDLKYYKDGDAAVAALRKGEVSFVSHLTPAQTTSLEHTAGIEVNDAPGDRFYALATNPGARARNGQRLGDGNPALLDPAVRRALFESVDRKRLVRTVFQGHAVVGQGYLPPRFHSYYWRPSAAQRVAYDPAAAARDLDRAGYRVDRQGRRLGKDGKPLTFRILCHATDPNDKAVSQYLKEWWAKLGIGLKVECLDNVGDPWLAGDYDLAFDGWSVGPDPDYVLSIHTCGALPATARSSGSTDNFICDPAYDRLYARQSAEYDPVKRAALVKRMESRLYDTGYMNVLAYPNAMEAYRTDQIASIETTPSAAGNIWGQNGYWSWWSAVPAASAAGPEGERPGGSPSTGALVALGFAAAVAAAGAVWFVVRRRATVDDRE